MPDVIRTSLPFLRRPSALLPLLQAADLSTQLFLHYQTTQFVNLGNFSSLSPSQIACAPSIPQNARPGDCPLSERWPGIR